MVLGNQICKVCGSRDKFNFNVSDEIWRYVIPEQFLNRVVCLACFDEFARRRGINYAPYLDNELHFVGDRACFIFQIVFASTTGANF